MPYYDARTPPFVDPADYGQPRKKFTPQWLQRPVNAPPPLQEPITAYTPPWRSSPAMATMEEPEVPAVPLSDPPPPPLTAPKLDPQWRSSDQARESTRAARDIYGEYMKLAEAPPQPQHRQTGWRRALHTIGDMFINPDIMHPNVARRRQEYEEKMEALGRVAQAAKQQAEEDRRQAALDAELQARAKQEATEERRQAQIEQAMNKPDPGFSLDPGQARYDASGKLIASAPAKPEPPVESTQTRTFNRMVENYMILGMPEEKARAEAARQMQRYYESTPDLRLSGIPRNKAQAESTKTDTEIKRKKDEAEKEANRLESMNSGDLDKAAAQADAEGKPDAAAVLRKRKADRAKGKKDNPLFKALDGETKPPPSGTAPKPVAKPSVPSDPLGLFK